MYARILYLANILELSNKTYDGRSKFTIWISSVIRRLRQKWRTMMIHYCHRGKNRKRRN